MKLYFDFSAILGIATLITGMLWAIDSLFLKSKRLRKNQAVLDKLGLAATDVSTIPPEEIDEKIKQQGEIHETAAKMPKWADYSRSFFPVLLLVFVLRAFIIEPFRIPSGSMRPTLQEGDFILVNKFAYGLRLPLTGTKLLDWGKPQRGDILVFRYPHDTSVDYIKRIIGLPGDKVKVVNKQLYVNGEPVSQEYIETNFETDDGGLRKVKRYHEQLDSTVYSIYSSLIQRPDFAEIEVPANHFFVLGDNRERSRDSREWGFVPEHLILGKAFFIWLSFDAQKKDIRWERFGSIQSSQREQQPHA
ncbi:MAG TPA: signal peptidase I [Gammaproteobacteria bacterium]|nr:signal peptidase I [Gammaproteobacteria bacterium]